MKHARLTSYLFLLACLLGAGALLRCAVPPPAAEPQAREQVYAERPDPTRLWVARRPLPKSPQETRMPNPQVTAGGAAVPVPMTTAGPGFSQPSVNNFAIYTPAVGGPPAFVCTGAIPASGGTTTVSGWSVTNLGTTTAIVAGTGSVNFPDLSVAAPSGATVEAGYYLEQNLPTTGAPNDAYAHFDVVAIGGGGSTRRRPAVWF